MKKKLKYIAVAGLLFGAGAFNTAKAITADELLVFVVDFVGQVNQAFDQIIQAVTDHENRITDLENASPNLGGYAMSFSADGAQKNVVVSTQPDGGGGTLYFVRSRYASSTEEISIDGTLTQRPFIANYAFAQVDNLGDLISVSNYIEAPDTENYIVFNVEETFFDPVSLAKTVDADTLVEDWNVCNYGQTTICIVDVKENLTGNHVRSYNWSSTRGISDGPLNVDSLNFPDVRLEQQLSSNQNYVRARAQGIGEVLRVANDGSFERRAIFYRGNGVTGGSLAGTPFDAGQPLDGLFF